MATKHPLLDRNVLLPASFTSKNDWNRQMPVDASSVRALNVLQEAELCKFGIWTFAQNALDADQSLLLARNSDLLTRQHVETIECLRTSSVPEGLYEGHFKKGIANISNFLLSDRHQFFWAAAEVANQLCNQGRQRTTEPELNGYLLGALGSTLTQAVPGDAEPQGSLGLLLSDQRALGNESHTGADFGIIVQIPTIDGLRYRVALVQAKRATHDRINLTPKEKTQLDILRQSACGYYLIYHAYQTDHGWNLPVVKAAETIYKENQVGAIHPGKESWDFPSFLTFGLASANCTVGAESLTRQDALVRLFNPSIVGLQINYVFIAILGARGMELQKVHEIRQGWDDLVDQARSAYQHGYTPFFRPVQGHDYLDDTTPEHVQSLERAGHELDLGEQREHKIQQERERQSERSHGMEL